MNTSQAASSLNVYLYTTLTFAQLRCCPRTTSTGTHVDATH
jgi:hypothetical protein